MASKYPCPVYIRTPSFSRREICGCHCFSIAAHNTEQREYRILFVSKLERHAFVTLHIQAEKCKRPSGCLDSRREIQLLLLAKNPIQAEQTPEVESHAL